MGASSSKAAESNIFEIAVQSIDNEEISLSQFKGKKAYLIVNVASKWGILSC